MQRQQLIGCSTISLGHLLYVKVGITVWGVPGWAGHTNAANAVRSGVSALGNWWACADQLTGLGAWRAKPAAQRGRVGQLRA